MTQRPKQPIRQRVWSRGWLASVIVGVSAVGGFSEGSAQTTSPPVRSTPVVPSLDDELLRDLPPVVPKKPADKGPATSTGDKPTVPPQGKPTETPTKPEKSSDGPNANPKPSDDEGEDIELASPDQFLRDIRRRMKQVEQRLRANDASRSTQSEQERIAAELDSFIRQLQRKQGQAGGSKQKQGGSGVASDQTGGAQQATKGPAVESAERNADAVRGGDGPASLEASLPGVWGSLTPQTRQQIQSLTSDKFLPQYERLIQQYYRRLTEPRRGS